MLGRFQELKSTISSKDGEGRARSKYTGGVSSGSTSKQRRRNLFTNHTPKEKEHSKKKVSKFLSRKYEEQIVEFSSSSEEEQVGSKNTAFSTKLLIAEENGSDTEYKNKGLCRRKRRRESAPANLSRQEDGKFLIDWSDSDVEADPPLTKRKLEQNNAALDAKGIKNFDSPKSPDKTGEVMFFIEDSTQSQLSVTKEDLERKVEADSTYNVKLCDSSKKKKSRFIKGGLVEQLKRVTAREMSSLVFWQHSANHSKSDSGTGENERIESALTLQISQAVNQYSLMVLICVVVDTQSETVCIILPDDKFKEMKLSVGNILKVFPPFEIVNVVGIVTPVILCAYFIKDAQKIKKEVKETNDIHQNKPLLLFGQEGQGHDADSNETSEDKQINFIDNFSSCCFFKPSFFVATVIKASITFRNSHHHFSATSDESIVDVFKKEAKKAKEQKFLEVSFLLWDKNQNAALLSYPLENYRTHCHYDIYSIVGKTMQFENFNLKEIRNAAFDPTTLSLLAKHDNTIQESCMSVPCFIFGTSFASLISMPKAKQSGEREVEEKLSEDAKMEISKQIPQRVSLFAKCNCFLPNVYQHSPTTLSRTYSLSLAKLCDFEQMDKWASNLDKPPSLVILEKLSSCFVPRFVSDSLLNYENVFLLKDLLSDKENNKVIADKYSEICLVHQTSLDNVTVSSELSGFGTFALDDCKLTKLKGHPVPDIPVLSPTSRIGTLVKVEGIVSGINEETATFWYVCDKCGEEVKDREAKTNLCCQSCGKQTGKKIHVQLDVLLNYNLTGQLAVCVKLLEETIYKYLPMQITEDFDGYDVDCIVGKKFGPKICCVVSKRQDNAPNCSKIIELQEVKFAKGLDWFSLEL